MLCSRTPARILRMPRKRYLAGGIDADAIIISGDLELWAVSVGGEVARRKT